MGQANQGQAWPTPPKQAGPRPRWFPRPRRGRYFDPWPQGNQGQAWPSLTIPSGNRPRWAPKLRRGRFTEPPWPQGPQGQAWPSLMEPAGSRPRWAPKLRRPNRFDPPWPQGPQTVWIPPVAVTRRSPPRPTRRGRFAQPGWPQAQQGQAYPSIYSQAGPRPRWAPSRFARRGRYLEPPWPQGTQTIWVPPTVIATRRASARPVRRGQLFTIPPAVPPGFSPSIIEQSGSRPRWAPKPRRGRTFEPPWPALTPPTMAISNVSAIRRTPSRPTRRGRFTEPPWTQPSAAFPLPLIVATRRAPARPSRRGHYAEPPWPQAQQGQPYPGVYDQAGSRPRWGAKLRRGRYFEPGWGQGAAGQAFPGIATQAGAHPKWLPRPRRGHLFEPPWPQGASGSWAPSQVGGRRPVVRIVRRTRFGDVPPSVVVVPTGLIRPASRRTAGVIRRGRFQSGPFAAPVPGFAPGPVRPAVRRAVGPARRGRLFWTPPVGLPSVVPSVVRGSRPRPPMVRRSRLFDPPWRQGPQTVWIPPSVIATRRVPSRPVRRGRFALLSLVGPAWGHITGVDVPAGSLTGTDRTAGSITGSPL